MSALGISPVRRITHRVGRERPKKQKSMASTVMGFFRRSKSKSRKEIVAAIRGNEEALTLAREFAFLSKEERGERRQEFADQIRGHTGVSPTKREMIKATKLKH
jgi:hypothetical protein